MAVRNVFIILLGMKGWMIVMRNVSYHPVGCERVDAGISKSIFVMVDRSSVFENIVDQTKK